MVNIQWNGDKCDLHRHMGGSISAETVLSILRRTGNSNLLFHDIEARMVCGSKNIGFPAFLDKFKILDELTWPEWAVATAVEQICNDMRAENIDYSEISLSINKYVDNNWDPADIIRFIYNAFDVYGEYAGVHVGLLLSIRYDSPRDTQLMYANLINNSRIAECLYGIDLIGDERYFDADFYAPIFDRWRHHGKTLRAHVGELPGCGDNVRLAIDKLCVTRIAHGIQASTDTMKLAADRQICFDVALHSNLYTGVWADIPTHPLRKLLDNGCRVTLNTDDPIQFRCTIDDEFSLAISNGLISPDEARQIMDNSWLASHHYAHNCQ